MARKKKLTEMIGVMIGEETSKKLTEITDKLECSKSEFIREILEKKLTETETDES
jgi:predicted DNA-binding protein